tara:strand:+ start:113 stop:574 length:462 start_codon:yes stop_codon:yes gene_type:complete
MRDNINNKQGVNMTLSNRDILGKICNRAIAKAKSKQEEDTIWTMADLNEAAQEAVGTAQDILETVKEIARVSRMKLNLGVNRKLAGNSTILENDGVETQHTAHNIDSLKTFINDELDHLASSLWRLNDVQQKEKPHLTGQEKIAKSMEDICDK